MVAGRQKFLIFENTKSGAAQQRLPRVHEFFEQGDVDVDYCALSRSLDIAKRIREAGDVDVVVAAGGDGTVNAVGQPVMDVGLPLAIIPCGTANDLARSLNIPEDPVAAGQVAVHGVERVINLGDVNGRIFFNVAHLGMSVDAMKKIEDVEKQEWGILAYLNGMAETLQDTRSFKVHMRLDGGEWRTITSIEFAVGNGIHYGGGMTMPEGALDGDALNLFSVDPQNVLDLLSKAPSFFSGSLERYESIFTGSAEEVEIKTDAEEDISADGEIATTTPATFTLLKDALTIIEPSRNTKE